MVYDTQKQAKRTPEILNDFERSRQPLSPDPNLPSFAWDNFSLAFGWLS